MKRSKYNLARVWALVIAILSYSEFSVANDPDSLQHPDEVHLRDIRQITFGGANAEAYFSTILAQHFEREKLRLSLGGIDYKHPVDIGDAWKEMNCSDCHFTSQ